MSTPTLPCTPPTISKTSQAKRGFHHIHALSSAYNHLSDRYNHIVSLEPIVAESPNTASLITHLSATETYLDEIDVYLNQVESQLSDLDFFLERGGERISHLQEKLRQGRAKDSNASLFPHVNRSATRKSPIRCTFQDGEGEKGVGKESPGSAERKMKHKVVINRLKGMIAE